MTMIHDPMIQHDRLTPNTKILGTTPRSNMSVILYQRAAFNAISTVLSELYMHHPALCFVLRSSGL